MNAGNSGNLRIGGGAKNKVKPGQSNDWDLDKFWNLEREMGY